MGLATTPRWLLAFALVFAIGFTRAYSVVTLERNGYKGVTVVIHKDVPEDPKLIENIKSIFASASSFLYVATRRRAYFSEISIVVPGSWRPNVAYKPIQGGDIYSKANIRVVEGKTDQLNADSDSPFTKQLGECGEEGEYIELTTNFINAKDEPFGPPGSVLVHEWAHLRYGVYDEYGNEGDESQSSYYLDGEGNIRSVGCSKGLLGWLRDEAGGSCLLDQDGLPDRNCLFYPDESTGTAKSSIMYMSGVKGIDQFCDDTKELQHNRFAPNKHNFMCQGKPTWNVIMNNKDFQEGQNLPGRQDLNTDPIFRVFQTKKNKQPTIVLVLDVSESMKGKRIELLHAAASRFIKYQVRDGSLVGMVKFSTSSTELAAITPVDQSSRAALVTKVPSTIEGSTCIGCGIVTALALLERAKEPTEGAIVLLVTDGEENQAPKLEQLTTKIQNSGIIINTIAFGTQASAKLEALIKLTGGRGHFYNDQSTVVSNISRTLDSALIESAITHADLELQPVEIINREFRLKNLKSKKGTIVLDKEVGKNVEFVLTYTNPTRNPVDFKLTSPSGKVYGSKNTEYESDMATLSIRIKFPTAQPGKWSYSISNKVDAPQDVSIVVAGEPLDVKDQPVRVRSWVNDVEFDLNQKVKFFAEVTKGDKVIINATVQATIYRPQGAPYILTLFDDGAAADVKKNDGVYTSYFTLFNGTGRYSVETTVVNDGKAKIKVSKNSRKGSRSAHKVPRFLPNAADPGKPEDSFKPENLISGTISIDGSDIYIEDEDFEQADEFERFASAGAFKKEEWYPDRDLTPPARVTDLKIDLALKKDWTAVLSWTSPGDDLDEGTVKSYALKYHWNVEKLVLSFDKAPTVSIENVTSGDLIPMDGKRKHQIVVRLPPSMSIIEDNGGTVVDGTVTNWPMDRLYFALRSTDDAGNEAELSNLALAHFKFPTSASNFLRYEIILLVFLWCLMVIF